MLMTKTIKTVVTVVCLAGLVNIAQAASPLTGNIGFTSNYIWRGVSQAGDESAISGGVDYTHASGFYAGTWVSSLGGGNQYEHDIYAGYGFKAGPVDLDAGYITYRYPVGNAALDFDEIYLNATFQNFAAGVALTLDTEAGGPDDNMYIYGKADFDVGKNLKLTLLVGIYDYDAPDTAGAEDYKHFHASLSKDDFTFAIDKNDTDLIVGGDDLRFSVSYSKSVDLM